MTSPLRILDTGSNPAGWNVGMTAALVEMHEAGRAPDTLRFYRSPPSVLLGRHQNMHRAVNIGRCQRKNVEIARRMTGGAAAFMRPGILAFDLIARRSDFGPRLGDSIALICTGLAAGIARMGLPARYQPSGSVVIDRQLAGVVTGTYDGLTLIFQGFIHVAADAAEMTEALAAPAEKGRVMQSAQRMTSLAAFLGRTPSNEEIIDVLAAGLSDHLRRPFAKGEIGPDEAELAGRLASREAEAVPLAASDGPGPEGAICVARQRSAGGYVEAHVRLTPGKEGRIDWISIAGDFAVAPTNAVQNLETALRGVPAAAAGDYAREALQESAITMLGAAPGDIAAVIAAAVKVKPARGLRSP